MTLAEIGRVLGVTRERVRQIIASTHVVMGPMDRRSIWTLTRERPPGFIAFLRRIGR